MPAKKDYYEILGVGRTATDKEIKAAYRKLARKYHPDVNAGDKRAEERFKELSEAFAVLSDPDKRARYDRGGHEAFGPGFDPFQGTPFQGGGFDFRHFDLGDLTDLFDLFGAGGPGRGRGRRQRRGQDLQSEIRIGFREAVRGDTVDLSLPDRVKVRIPAGIEDGGRIRVPGKGTPGAGGAPPGDLFLVVRVEPDPVFRREGRDLVADVPVGLARAALGGTVEIPTLDGPATVTLPAGTRSGQKLRLKGRGVPASGGAPAGDLYGVVQIVPPRSLDDRSRRLLEEFERLNPGP